MRIMTGTVFLILPMYLQLNLYKSFVFYKFDSMIYNLMLEWWILLNLTVIFPAISYDYITWPRCLGIKSIKLIEFLQITGTSKFFLCCFFYTAKYLSIFNIVAPIMFSLSKFALIKLKIMPWSRIENHIVLYQQNYICIFF